MGLKASAKAFFSWFTPDRILALVGIAAAVVAIYYETELHNKFTLQEKTINGIVSSVTTRYVARFPANLEYATNVISAAKTGEEVLILNDVLGYGYYSCPPKFEEYIEAIKHAGERKANVMILIYGDGGAKEVLKTQFPPEKYQALISDSGEYKNTTTNACKRKTRRRKDFGFIFIITGSYSRQGMRTS